MVLLTTLLPLTVIRVGIQAEMLPSVELCILYCFAIYYPLWYAVVLIYGIFVSEIYNTPFGLESLLFIITYYVLLKYQNVLLSNKPTSNLLGFICTAITFGSIKYLIISQYFNLNVELYIIALQIMITILFFPSIEWIMCRIFKRLELDAK